MSKNRYNIMITFQNYVYNASIARPVNITIQRLTSK